MEAKRNTFFPGGESPEYSLTDWTMEGRCLFNESRLNRE
jgi:hypothetical protein